MFQSFIEKSEKEKTPQRLHSLRELMKGAGVDWYLVPHSDEYQNEYLPEMAERLAWITGFTGSAGFCIIGMETAHVFVDGRYTLQVVQQTDPDCFTPEDLVGDPPAKWLRSTLKKDQVVGIDPWLLTHNEQVRFESTALECEATLLPLDNLIDELWQDQPSVPLESVKIHDIAHAGELAFDKIARVRDAIEEKDLDACLITDPTSICWLYNIRGDDVIHTPLVLARTLVLREGHPLLFIDKRKLSREVEAYLTQLADLYPPNQLDEQLAKHSEKSSVQADLGNVPAILTGIIENNGTLVGDTDPVTILKACKNTIEQEGARKAHIRDGVAITRFLYWLDQQRSGSITEIGAAKALEQFRAENAEQMQSKLLDISFDSISASGPHSAIPHYRVTEESDLTIPANSIYLVDSGGQYIEGTTDITRTVAIGTPPDEAIHNNTLVLKGHIAVALARFPVGTRGMDIDPLARNALWREGKDFAHGTGHGVGSYLGVHEGPQRIARTSTQQLMPGMILSNEPGYYVEGEYGIRIENLIIVSEPEALEGGNVETMGFETITLAPIDLRLVDPALMTDDELHWLNAYHGWVNRTLAPHMSEAEQEWLADATRPILRELPAASA